MTSKCARTLMLFCKYSSLEARIEEKCAHVWTQCTRTKRRLATCLLQRNCKCTHIRQVSAEIHMQLYTDLSETTSGYCQQREYIYIYVVYYVLQSCQCCYAFVQLAPDSEGQAVAERPIDRKLQGVQSSAQLPYKLERKGTYDQTQTWSTIYLQ